jgi:hypothetical protein
MPSEGQLPLKLLASLLRALPTNGDIAADQLLEREREKEEKRKGKEQRVNKVCCIRPLLSSWPHPVWFINCNWNHPLTQFEHSDSKSI